MVEGESTSCVGGCSLQSLGCFAAVTTGGDTTGVSLHCDASGNCETWQGNAVESVVCLARLALLGAVDTAAFPALRSVTYVGPISRVHGSLCPPGSALTRIVLRGAELEDANASAFSDCSSLVELDLRHNRLTSLVPDLLAAASALQTLDLSNNLLQFVPGTLLDACVNLTILKLTHNGLLSLPVGFLPPSYLLKSPYFEIVFGTVGYNPEMVGFPADLFVGTATLTSLSLASLTYIPTGLFDFQTKLQTLGLEGSFASFPPGIFRALTELRALYINSTGVSVALSVSMFASQTAWKHWYPRF